jgi:glycosyltransferase involved in cell wall biosynthesis
MPVNVLFDLRPALAGYAGIPQEARLLFSALQGLHGAHVDGLIQSGTQRLPPGSGLAAARLAQALQGSQGGRLRRLSGLGLALAAGVLRGLRGRAEPLGRFATAGFEDVVWRCIFEKTLTEAQRPAVLRAGYRVLRLPRAAAHAKALLSGLGGSERFPLIDTEGYDVMIAETPYPGRVRPGTRLIVRYHDAIPLTMPQTVRRPGFDRTLHLDALRQNVADGAWFACVSDVTRQDLLLRFPAAAPRCVVIPNFIAPQYRPEAVPVAEVAALLRRYENSEVSRLAARKFGAPEPARPPRSGAPRYLLMVSTLEPRKNHLGLLRAWKDLRVSGHGDLQLVLVGSLGWRHGKVLAELMPWLGCGEAHLLEAVPSEQLRTLYRHAAVTVCPSAGEGFGYSGVEALLSGGRVVASDLAVHREVYGEAAGYFEPNSDTALAAALRLSLAQAHVEDAEAAASRRSAATAAYDPGRLVACWDELLRRAVRKPP